LRRDCPIANAHARHGCPLKKDRDTKLKPILGPHLVYNYLQDLRLSVPTKERVTSELAIEAAVLLVWSAFTTVSE
jgi:hypothetical protein